MELKNSGYVFQQQNCELRPCRVKALHGFLFFNKQKGDLAMQDKNFLTAEDVAQYMGISVSMAYKVIRKLNEEMKERGYITISG